QSLHDPESAVRKQLQRSIYMFFKALMNDEALRHKISEWAYESIVNLAARYRNEIGNLIANTIRQWDKATLSSKLELQVGKDLQYIRINGTLVGGIVGFLLHAIGNLLQYFLH